MEIPEDTLRINFIELNKKENNPWELLKEKFISPSKTPDIDSIIVTSKTIKDTPDKLLRNIYKGTFTLRFRQNIEDNPFRSSVKDPVLPTFPTWTSIDDTFYYNFLNKDKGLAKRKVTFGQTLTTKSPSILSGRD